jgi:hypothetical protein
MEKSAFGSPGGLNLHGQVREFEFRKLLLKGLAKLISDQSLREFCTFRVIGCVIVSSRHC